MTTTIGRVSLTNAPRSMSQSGDMLSFEIDIVGLSLAVAKVKRQQLLGLVDNADEPVVPVTWSDDSDLDGFYRVLGVTVEPSIMYLTNGYMRCQVQLERVGGGYAKPLMEVSMVVGPFDVGTALTLNPSGATNWLVGGFPYGTGEAGGAYSGGYAPVSTGTKSISTATGTIRKVDAFTSLAATATNVFGLYAFPSEAYAGACLIEQQIGGTWYPVVGRQISRVGRDWRISNGIVRLSLSQATLGALLIEVWGGSAWESLPLLNRLSEDGATTGYFGLIDPSTNADTTAVDPVIIRNAPESVTVLIPQIHGLQEVYTIGRGVPYGTLFLPATVTSTAVMAGIKLTTPAAVTTITSTDLTGSGAAEWGFRTATDGNGNRLIVLHADGSSGIAVDTAAGRHYDFDEIGAIPIMFGVTSDPAGGTVAEFETSAVAASMFTASSSQQQVVAR